MSMKRTATTHDINAADAKSKNAESGKLIVVMTKQGSSN